MPATPAPTTLPEAQPWVGASMIAQSSSPSPAIESIAPAGSVRVAVGFVESGTSTMAPTMPATAIGDVDEEDRAPPETRQQQPTGDGSDRDSESDGPGPGTDGPGTLGRVAEGVVEDRQRRGDRERRTDTHDRSKADEQVHGIREPGAYGSGCEDDQPDEKEALAPEPIGESTADEQQPREHHGIGIHDPLQRAGRGMQLPDQGREGDVENGVVHVDDQRRQTDDDHHEPTVSSMLRMRHRRRTLQQVHTWN